MSKAREGYNNFLDKTCKWLDNLFNKMKTPAMVLPKYLLLCSAMQRPGESCMDVCANIIKDLDKMGIPTGPNPDGTPNLIVATACSIAKNLIHSRKFDGVTHSIIPKGALQIIATGGNAGGPVVCHGFNFMDTIIYGISS